MGKLRIFGTEFKIKYDKSGTGSWFNTKDKEVGIDSTEPHSIAEDFFHELIELLLYNSSFRYIRNGTQDPSFFMSHIEMGELARKLAHVLLDNGLIAESKIKKFIEEK